MADYIIVGAGLFGASTALHLVKAEPHARIVLLDRTPYPCPSAAASDLNKIIRADYGDLMYMDLALEAMQEWKTNPLYKPFFHDIGLLLAEDFGMGRASYKNYQTLGVNTDARILTPDDARREFPVFRNANWDDVEDNYYNPSAGWGDADGAMRAVTKAALSAGVEYVQATASRLVFDADGSCVGVRAENNDVLKGSKVLLCTGGWTAKLIADSAPNNQALQVHGRLVAAAATSCVVRCDPDYQHLYRNTPVHVLSMPHTRGECIPLNSDGKMKFNYENSFTNKVFHEESGQTISVPPSSVDQTTWSQNIPDQLKHDLNNVVQNVFGKDAPGLSVEAYRMCWDSITPNQDFIISPHPACKGLYVAGGGSFHSWKFLPTIGKYVSAMLQNTLAPDKAQKWAWDRGNEGAALVVYIPKKDLGDFKGFVAAG